MQLHAWPQSSRTICKNSAHALSCKIMRYQENSCEITNIHEVRVFSWALVFFKMKFHTNIHLHEHACMTSCEKHMRAHETETRAFIGTGPTGLEAKPVHQKTRIHSNSTCISKHFKYTCTFIGTGPTGLDAKPVNQKTRSLATQRAWDRREFIRITCACLSTGSH